MPESTMNKIEKKKITIDKIENIFVLSVIFIQ